MKNKGEKTRADLMNTAVELFSEKGYSAVTMKDFCERHGLSRSGIYRHFASTREIFLAMLDSDRENASDELNEAISSGISAKQMSRSAFSNGFKAELASDCHSTYDSNLLSADQIIAHHNTILSQFAQIKSAAEIKME
jgi:AcrR family transcriptional regulator